MGRVYSIPTGFQAVSAAQDLIELKAGASRSFKLLSLTISCTTDYDDTAGVQVSVRRAAGSYTAGSGGSAATVVKLNSGDAADSFATKTRNNTTPAVAGSGTLETFYEEAMAPAAGFQFVPTPEMQPVFAASEGLVVSVSLPADEITMSAVAIVEEL